MQVSLNTIKFNSYPVIGTKPINQVHFCSNPAYKISFPDLKQRDIKGKEEFYCGPVSVANGIIMFAEKGFPNLYQSGNSAKLIEKLAAHFKTDNDGTTTSNMLEGLNAFIKSKGYKSELNYQGFRPASPIYKERNTNIPDFYWVKNEIQQGNAVFLNFGVYKPSTEGGKTVYKRQYGHFVTATGNGTNGISIDPNSLTIHDPYSRMHGDIYLKCKKIDEGKFIHNKDDNEATLTDKAAGFYKISPLDYFSHDEVGVLEGAISLKIHN